MGFPEDVHFTWFLGRDQLNFKEEKMSNRNPKMSATLRGRIVRRRVGHTRQVEATYTVSLSILIQVRH